MRAGERSWPDVRPLDRVRSIKIKLGVLVTATVTVAALLVWFGLNNGVRTLYTLPTAIALSLVVTQLLARGMTSPLREMTAAARSMATGDYSRRVQATSHDEVGELAVAFNRMAEDLGSVDRQRRELVANVSHELRTPVTALRATLENLVDGVADPDPATLTTALAQTERLGTLVAQLLDLSRLEAGVVPLDVTDLPVATFLDEAVAAARLVDVAVDRTVVWEVDVEPDDLTVRADPARLHQVVANLLDNAARHSPPGGRVRVTAAPVAGPTGCGRPRGERRGTRHRPGRPRARVRAVPPRRGRAVGDRRHGARPGDRALGRGAARRQHPGGRLRDRLHDAGGAARPHLLPRPADPPDPPGGGRRRLSASGWMAA